MANRMLYEVCSAIESHLSPFFSLFKAKVIDCPNLCRRPFNFSRSAVIQQSLHWEALTICYLQQIRIEYKSLLK
nr:hypothetical transcript [Hymenolepis microstoma]